jgi:hypothetical protein
MQYIKMFSIYKYVNLKGWDCQIKLKEQDLPMCFLLEIHFKYKDTNSLNVKGWEKIDDANSQKKT